MDEDILRFSTNVQPTGDVTVAVRGYLDDDGARALARELRGGLPADNANVLVDLERVTLFNCSGARCLLKAISDLHRQGRDVDLIGVRPPLQRVLDLAS